MPIDISQDHDVVMEAQQVLAHNAKSFRLASLFLPKKRANDAAVIYHFCRLLDDAVDEAPTPESAREEAEQLHQELIGTRPARPAVTAYLAAAGRLGIPDFAAHDLMDGICSDLEEVRVQDTRELGTYCYRVAGTVGLMMCAVLGVKEREAWPFAIDLGLAMQITNISRDVLEDARRERVYIPETFLAAHGTSSEKVCSEDIELKARKAVIDSMLEIAEISYTRARVGMHFIPMRARLAIFIAMRVYRSIGLSLQRNYGSDPFHGRTIVSRWGKCIAVLHGVVDFCDPRTWFARRAPASPFYTDWKELRASK